MFEDSDEAENHDGTVDESSGEGIKSLSSDGSSMSSDKSDAEAVPSLSIGASQEDTDIPGPVWMNKKSKTVHKSGSTAGVTFCGRRVQNTTFQFSELGTTSLNPRCTHCYRHELIANKEQMAHHLEVMARKRARRD